MPEPITVTFSEDEALVLFENLARSDKSDAFAVED